MVSANRLSNVNYRWITDSRAGIRSGDLYLYSILVRSDVYTQDIRFMGIELDA